MKSLVEKWFLPFLIGFILAVSAIVILFIAGKLSPREMGYSVAAVWLAAVVILTRNFGKARKDPSPLMPAASNGDANSRQKVTRAIGYYRVIVIGMLFLLIYALVSTRNEPPLPRIIGAFISIAITGVFIIAIRFERAKLG